MTVQYLLPGLGAGESPFDTPPAQLELPGFSFRAVTSRALDEYAETVRKGGWAPEPKAGPLPPRTGERGARGRGAVDAARAGQERIAALTKGKGA